MADIPPSIDLFHQPNIVNHVIKSEHVSIKPSIFSREAGICLFNFNSGATSFLSSNILLKATTKIVKGDGKPLTASDSVAPCSNLALNMWSDIVVKANDTILQSDNGLSNLVNNFTVNHCTSTAARNGFLKRMILHYPEEIGSYDSTTGASYTKRSELFELSKSVTTIATLPLLISQSQKLIMPDISMSVQLTHALNPTRLISSQETENYKLVIEALELIIIKNWLKEDTVSSIYNRFHELEYVNYAYIKPTIMGPFSLPSGNSNYQISLGRASSKPLAVLMFAQSSDRYLGKYTKNAYKYETLHWSHIIAKYGSAIAPNSSGFNPRLPEGLANADFVPEFAAFVEFLSGDLKGNSDSYTEYDRYLHDQAVICFRFTDLDISKNYISPIVNESEELSINMTLSKPSAVEQLIFVIVIAPGFARYTKNRTWQLDNAPSLI